MVGYTFRKINPANITVCWLTIKQGDYVINKTLADASLEDNKLTWKLTQEETLKLRADQHAPDIEKQIRYKTLDGNAYISKITRTKSYALLKEGVI